MQFMHQIPVPVVIFVIDFQGTVNKALYLTWDWRFHDLQYPRACGTNGPEQPVYVPMRVATWGQAVSVPGNDGSGFPTWVEHPPWP